MSDNAKIELVRRLIEVGFGEGDVDVLDELMATDVVEHQRGNRSGIEGAREVVRTLHRWMADFSLTVEDAAVSGDVVWTRNRGRGVNTGSVMGNAPTGKAVEIDVIDIVRLEGGRVVEHWGVADQLGLMLQLGLIPGPDRGAGRDPGRDAEAVTV
jgi:predicted ester cyclase